MELASGCMRLTLYLIESTCTGHVPAGEGPGTRGPEPECEPHTAGAPMLNPAMS
jgi:hypothetical protein